MFRAYGSAGKEAFWQAGEVSSRSLNQYCREACPALIQTGLAQEAAIGTIS